MGKDVRRGLRRPECRPELCHWFPAMGFPGGSAGKESACNVGDLGLIAGLGRSPGEGKGYPLQYSGMENSMNYTVHEVAKSQTRVSNFHLSPMAALTSFHRLSGLKQPKFIPFLFWMSKV